MGPLALLLVGIVVVVLAILVFRWHPFIALTAAGLIVAGLTPAELVYRASLSGEAREELRIGSGGGEVGIPDPVPESLAPVHAAALKRSQTWFVDRFTEAFGKGCAGIAVIIAMAAIIGRCLLDSGGAKRIVDALLGLFGRKGTPFAFSASAFTLGIPVFFDTVFYLLMPLGKAMRRETGKDYLLYVLTIVAGATMAHSLVPPTPGPLTVAGFFGDEVPVGMMMIGGIVLGLFTVSVGIAYAYWANRRWEIPLRGEDALPEIPGETASAGPPPSLWLSLLPIVLPVALIGGETVLAAMGHEFAAIRFLGDKNIALILSAATAVGLLVVSRRAAQGGVREAVQSALASGGVIILITAAGSAFGAVLKDTGIAEYISGSIEGRQSLMLIPVAFLTTALIRTAQGSATVAMITAGGMIAPIASGAELSYSALYLALAIGCGSKPISWANDSGFWVIGRMTGMTPLETFKTVSVMMLLMSIAGLGLILVGAVLLPLV